MDEAFCERNGRHFPLRPFAERVYEWRKSGESDISVDGFEVEAAELSEDRLMIQRTENIRKAQGEEERTRWFFRHERIMDFFLLPAFLGEEQKERRFDNIEDERFLGVYELLAERLPNNEECELYAFLNDWAANTNQNETSKPLRVRTTEARYFDEMIAGRSLLARMRDVQALLGATQGKLRSDPNRCYRIAASDTAKQSVDAPDHDKLGCQTQSYLRIGQRYLRMTQNPL